MFTQRRLWTLFGFVAYVAVWVLVDFALHRGSWGGGHALHRLREILPELLWSAVFFFMFRLWRKLRQDARS